MSGIHMALLGSGSSFTPVTNTYTTGTAATETVPTGATQVVITVDNSGAAGGRDVANLQPGGGGGGARGVKTIAVTGGNTFTYTVAGQVNGRSTDGVGASGGTSTVTGTVAGGTVNIGSSYLVATGGGINGNEGSGGVYIGSDVDSQTVGANGSFGVGGSGGSGAGPDTAPGGGGSGVVTGTSGAGARGQISFAYT